MIKKSPGYYLRSLYYVLKAAFKAESRKDRFSRYAHLNKWKDKESVSGPGSTLVYTENIRAELPKLFKKLRIKSMFDAPCGDFNWIQHLARPGIVYLGGDIVPALIRNNNEKYADDKNSFREIDIVKDPLPKADIWLCRDALPHFSEENIYETLANFFRSDITWIFTSHYTKCTQNRDIRTGSFREVNFLLSPFLFPKPELCVDDWIEGFPVRGLCLWKRETLFKALKDRPEFQKYL
jgi:hypothetical protein